MSDFIKIEIVDPYNLTQIKMDYGKLTLRDDRFEKDQEDEQVFVYCTLDIKFKKPKFKATVDVQLTFVREAKHHLKLEAVNIVDSYSPNYCMTDITYIFDKKGKSDDTLCEIDVGMFKVSIKGRDLYKAIKHAIDKFTSH